MSKRIAVNTAATYTRTVLGAGLALFSSRWVLNALGQMDYGLFSVVGSVILFITFLNTVMAGSASRHFAYSIGAGDSTEVNGWFNSAIGIHLSLACLLVFIGWPIGEYVVGHVLTIPVDRIAASRWVFRVSLVSAFVSMASVPFVAMFTAKQHIGELAIWDTLRSILTFTLAYSLRYVSSDRLLFYSVGMVVILVLVQVAQICRAVSIFDECCIVIRKCFDRRKFKEIFSFASWTLIGNSGGLLRDQGSAILLNLLFGPNVNAAYGIASQLSSQTNQLSAAMIGAFSPEITACEGRGDRTRMLSLSHRASKFGTILVLLLAIPLIVEMDYVLKAWLHKPPLYAGRFCQVILCAFIIDRLSTGYMLAVSAHGKIAAYQATIGTTMVLTLPLAWFFLKIGLAPTSIGIAFVITMSIISVGRVFWGRHLFGTPVRIWLSSVLWPTIMVASLSCIAALVPLWFLSSSFLRLLLVIAASASTALLASWFLALDRDEREFVRQGARRFLNKLGMGSRPEESCMALEKKVS